MTNREIKFIIVRDKKTNRLHWFKSENLHHYELSRVVGYNSSDILEAGLILSGQLYILESVYLDHLKKRANEYIGNKLAYGYEDIRLKNWLRGRELESSLYYSKKPAGQLGEGD